jgi:hypothetical protein
MCAAQQMDRARFHGLLWVAKPDDAPHAGNADAQTPEKDMTVTYDTEVARAVVMNERRRQLTKLFAALAVEDNPCARDAIMGAISLLLRERNR